MMTEKLATNKGRAKALSNLACIARIALASGVPHYRRAGLDARAAQNALRDRLITPDFASAIAKDCAMCITVFRPGAPKHSSAVRYTRDDDHKPRVFAGLTPGLHVFVITERDEADVEAGRYEPAVPMTFAQACEATGANRLTAFLMRTLGLSVRCGQAVLAEEAAPIIDEKAAEARENMRRNREARAEREAEEAAQSGGAQ